MAPKVVALMTDSNVHSAKLWREIFFLFAGVPFLGGIIFTMFASGEMQKWAKDDLNMERYELLRNEAHYNDDPEEDQNGN